VAAPASADPATPTNYRSQVVYVEGPGVATVEVIGGDAFVRLTAVPGVTLEVLGYEGEEYIRFDPDGSVYVNQRSPSKYLNDDRYADVVLPAEADSQAAPRWEAVSADATYSWHDHRTHWMSPTPPAAVGALDGAQTVQIFDWVLPFRADGEDGKIVGVLTWVPGATRVPWFALAVMMFVVFAAGSMRLGARPQAVLLLALAIAALVGGLASMAAQPPEGRIFGIDLLGPPVVVGLGILALAQAKASARAATRYVLIGSIGLAVWGFMRVGVLTHPILPTVLPYALDRLIAAGVIGGAIGLVVGITASITLENRSRRITGDGYRAS
jgi:hypothetical protein